MGLATPTSIMVGTGRAAELGVLFRKGEALQRLEEVRVVAIDRSEEHTSELQSQFRISYAVFCLKKKKKKKKKEKKEKKKKKKTNKQSTMYA